MVMMVSMMVTNLFNSRADQDPLVEEVDVQRLGGRDDQPDHIYANLTLKVKGGKCFCLVFVWVHMWRLVSRLVDSKTFLNVLRVVVSIDLQCLGWRDDQPHHVYANLVLKLKSSNCFCLVFV